MIKKLNAGTIKEMGKIMRALKEEYSDKLIVKGRK